MGIIVAAVVSLITQVLKQYAKNQWQTLGIVIALSLVGAGVYTYLVAAGYWTAFASILVTASAIYTLIIARFE